MRPSEEGTGHTRYSTLMMIKLIILTLLLVASVFGGADVSGSAPINVTYVGNTGYLVECAGRKVAIDALLGGEQSEWYDIPSDSLVALMREAQQPFDDIDVIAVTHWHHDHFTAPIVAAYLKRNSLCILLCPQQVADQLAELPDNAAIEKQIHVIDAPVDSVTSLDLNGIGTRILTSKHGAYYETDSTGQKVDRHANVQHLEFLFNIGGRVFLHVGDVGLQDMERYRLLGLGTDSIDAALVQRWGCYEKMTFGEKLVRERIRPKRIFFTHIAPKERESLQRKADCTCYRGVTIPLRGLEHWVLP